MARPARFTCSLLVLAAPLVTVAGGCLSDDSSYVVLADARLAPLDGSGVSGTLLFGHGEGYPDKVDASPQELKLADDAPHRIMVMDAEDCGVDRATARAFDPPPAAVDPGRPDGDLGSIRRRADGVWFWRPASLPDDGPEGAFVFNSGIGAMSAERGRAGSMLGKIVVVRARGADGTPGAWEACGRIAQADYER